MGYKIVQEDNSKGYCLECGDRLPYGYRTDRKFCSVECKNRWHNRKHWSRDKLKVRTLSVLDRNYAILERLIKLKVKRVTLESVLHLGFNPEYITCCHQTGREKTYYCYDIAYTLRPLYINNIRRIATIDDEDSPDGNE